MHVTRFAEAQPYFPPAHFDMRCLRLQGQEAGPSETMWLGVSQIEPGGYTSSSASPVEKFYVVLDGDLTIETPDGETNLHRRDSCRIAPGEARALKNNSASQVTVLLAMPLVAAK